MSLIVSLITIIVMLVGFIVFMLWLDSDGFSYNLKLRFIKGSVLAIVIGKDRRIYMEAVKVTAKDKSTQEIRLNGLPYTFDPSKIYMYKMKPVLIYYEGVTMPLMIDTTQNLGYGKLTPELLNQIIITARQSGAIPKDNSNLETLKTIAIFGACAGALIGAYLIWDTRGLVDKIPPAINTMYNALIDFTNATVKP